MENSMEAAQKVRSRVTIYPSNPSSGYLPEKIENIYFQRYVHLCVHFSNIHRGQDKRKTEVSLNR